MMQDTLEFKLNNPQARALTVMANETWLLWSRGTGKTVGAIAPWILHKVEMMPRSTGGFVAKTFTDFKSKIIEPLYEAFGLLGHQKDEHYVFGRRPPDDWEKPYIPVEDYSNVFSFPNGTTIKLISLQLKGSANSLSLQWLVADEAKFLDEVRLRGEVFPILRGNAKYFGDSPWYGAKLFVTDKLSPSIHWILAKKKLMDAELVETIIFFQLQVNELVAKMITADQEKRTALRTKLRKLTAVLSVLRKKCVFYSEAKAEDNIDNLRPEYFDNMRRTLTAYEYSISIDNENPTRVENGFYASRTAKHLYSAAGSDDDTTRPLAIALDYQASISPLVAAQVNDLVVPGMKTLNFVQAVYVKHPLGLKHVVDDLCKSQEHRICKHVFYYYDHTAVGVRNTHKKFYEEVQQYFTDNGWRVTLMYMGAAPKQNNKYSRINHFLQNESAGHYPIRINQDQCATMVLSMDQTGTKEGGEEGTKKDKSTERDMNFPQEQSTHFSDAFDMLAWGILELGMYPAGAAPVGRVGFG